MNIARDPRWGRIEEVAGECPTLVAAYARAVISGMQRGGKNESSADARYWKTAAVAKHYVGYSLDCVDPAHPHVGCTEIPDRRWHPWVAGDRHHFNANISKQDMEDSFLPAFAACVQANVSGVM